MEYIKHQNEFYKKVELKKLDKKELIKLITEAIEIQPKIIEKWNTTYNGYTWYPRHGYSVSDGVTGNISARRTLTGTAALTNLSTDNLITLCQSI